MIEGMETGLAAIFTGDIETQPVVHRIADTDAAERRAVEPALVVPTERLCREKSGCASPLKN